MIPIDQWGTTDGLPDARKAFLQADESIVAKYGLIPRVVYFDGNENDEIYPSIEGLTCAEVRKEMIIAGQSNSAYLPNDVQEDIDVVANLSVLSDAGDKESVEKSRNFRLDINQVGFNIAEQGKLTSEGYATISMRSGKCAGREFRVKSCSLTSDGLSLTVERAWDESLGMGFPNTIYPIEIGDKFVLLDIPMPDYYITLAEKRLYSAAQKLLADYTRVSAFYEPEINPIKIKEGGKLLREGMYMQVYDEDVIDTDSNTDFVLIDTLSIDESGPLPSYRVTLREQKRAARTFSALEDMIEDVKESTKEDIRRERTYTERRFRAAQETAELLQNAFKNFSEGITPATVQTMQLLLGGESLQYRFTESRDSLASIPCPLSYNASTKQMNSTSASLVHLTLGISQITSPGTLKASDYKSWDIPAWDSEVIEDSEPRYIYVQAPKNGDPATFILPKEVKEMDDPESEDYFFLVGILNSEYDDTRDLVTLYGFTEVLPGQISTDIIRSADGQTYFDLVNGIISGKIRFESGSSGLENLPEWVEVKETAEEALEKADSIGEEAFAELEAYIDNVRQELQEQIDGAVDSYFEDYEPSTTNYPAKDWSEEEKEAHLNDTFTNLTDGRSWRWSKSAGVYTWVEIADTATSEALRIAGQAKDAADKKIRMFVEQPYTPYSVGDLWSRGEEAPLMRCINAKDSGAFDEDDWGLADNSQAYTDEAVGNIKLGGDNLLRNSGFTGDYLSERIADDSVLEAADELYSAPLDHWSSSNATVVDSDETVSGKAVSLTLGEISQELYYNIIAGEQYTISFKAQGSGSISCTVADVTISVPLTEEWTKYERVVTINEPINAFRISNATCTLGDLKLESGNRASTWKPSFLDNSSDRAYWQSMKYMQSALKGATDVNGGLVLTEMIQVGDYDEESKTWRKRNGGMNGIYENDNDVAFWAGGNFEQAIATVMKYVENPNYQPTETELASMAKFVVTHGGNAIFNNAILRGTILAKAGSISGFKIEDDWLRAEGENYETIVSPARIAAKADGVELSTGTYKSLVNMQAYPGAGIPSVHMARVELTPSREFPEERAIAVYASAKGANTAKYDPAALGDYLGEYGGNYAFYSPYGMFAGLRPKCVVLSDGQTYRCSPVDHTLISNSVSGTNRIYLPEDPQDGQVIKIWKNNAHLLYLNTLDSKQMIRMNISSATEHGIETAFMGTIELIYHSEIGAWLMIIHETY